MLAAASVAMAFALTACGDSPEEIAQETVKKMGETDMSSAYYWSKTTVDEYSKAIALINKIPDSELNNLSVCLGNSFAQPHQTYKVQKVIDMCLNAYKHKDTGGTIWGKETVDKLKFLEKKIELMVHCEGIVQSRMNDPKSFEVIDGRWFFKRDNQCAKAREANANETCTEWTATYRFKFSGKNAFGGRVQQAAKFVFDANTSELIDAEIE